MTIVTSMEEYQKYKQKLTVKTRIINQKQFKKIDDI